MRLALSAEADPSASLEELAEACVRRGLVALHPGSLTAADDAVATLNALDIELMHNVEMFELNAAVDDLGKCFVDDVTPPPVILLRGGGPEAAAFEGRGIGALMARLAISGYQGTIVLAPTSRAVVPVWRTWLNRGRSSWGCGSKTTDATLVQLG